MFLNEYASGKNNAVVFAENLSNLMIFQIKIFIIKSDSVEIYNMYYIIKNYELL